MDMLKKVLQLTISSAQGDFLVGRQLLDQALFANEAI